MDMWLVKIRVYIYFGDYEINVMTFRHVFCQSEQTDHVLLAHWGLFQTHSGVAMIIASFFCSGLGMLVCLKMCIKSLLSVMTGLFSRAKY